DDVGRLARNHARIQVVASDQRTILAVAVEVEVGIQLQLFAGETRECCGKHKNKCEQPEFHWTLLSARLAHRGYDKFGREKLHPKLPRGTAWYGQLRSATIAQTVPG